MKKIFLPLLLCAALLLCACARAEELKTAVGDCTVTQDFVSSIKVDPGTDVTAAEGNILLVITLTPKEGVTVDLDKADDYFMNGTKITLGGKEYDIKCVVYERKSAGDPVIKCRLVFEVKDNNYAEAAEKPDVRLTLPSVP